jgi:hypothetical protein
VTDDEKRIHFAHLRDTAQDSRLREYWGLCLAQVGSAEPISRADLRWDGKWTREMHDAVAWAAPNGPLLKD